MTLCINESRQQAGQAYRQERDRLGDREGNQIEIIMIHQNNDVITHRGNDSPEAATSVYIQ